MQNISIKHFLFEKMKSIGRENISSIAKIFIVHFKVHYFLDKTFFSMLLTTKVIINKTYCRYFNFQIQMNSFYYSNGENKFQYWNVHNISDTAVGFTCIITSFHLHYKVDAIIISISQMRSSLELREVTCPMPCS